MRASRRAVVVVAAAAAVFFVLVAARHVIALRAVQTILSTSTGYDVRIGGQQLGTAHAVFFDVHVFKNGDPVLDAQRVDVDYALRDIFPGGAHRFGFAAIAIQKPILTITRHADGTLTFNRTGGTPATAPTATRKATEPYYFTARIRDGAIRLVDAAPLQPDLANQAIEHVSIDASVKSDARTTVRLDGTFLGRRVQGGPIGRYPLHVRSVIDAQRGIALNAFSARELPLRGALGFFIHSRALRFDDGVLDGVDVRAFALAPKPDDGFDYRLGGHAQLTAGRLALSALRPEVRGLHGSLVVVDDLLASGALAGTINGVPMHGRGALYDLVADEPSFRLAFAADGDLHLLRGFFDFSSNMPLHGAAHVETLLASHIAKPLIHTWFGAPAASYDRYPLAELDGIVDYFDGAVVLDAIHGRYGGADLGIGGRVLVTDHGNDVNIAVNARGAGAALPYTDVLAPDSGVIASALFTQPIGAGFTARGTIGAVGATTGSGTFAVAPNGVGEFGPFDFSRADGSSLAGAFELQRPISQSAGWIHARGFRLAEVRTLATLPGASIAGLPPISGVVDGDLAGGGTPDAFEVAGTIGGRDLRAAGYDIGSGSVRLAGTLDDVRLADIRVDGPLGRFSGEGAYGADLLALDGTYDGSLERLRPLTGEAGARGALHGPIRATLAANRVVVQTTGLNIAGGSVRGVALEHAAGTVLVEGNAVRVLAADGTIGGARAVAGDTGGAFLVSAPDVPVAALRDAGLPFSRGTLSLFGVADLRGRGPRFDGVVALAGGLAAGYPVSGDADLDFAGGTARIRTGAGALGSTYGTFAGTVARIGLAQPAYDLTAAVPVGDVGEVRRALRVPVRTLEGSFSARLHVGGSGAQPRVGGDVTVPEGSYNGLAFHDGRAAVAVSPSSASARDGSVTIGSTRARIGASVAGRAFAVDVRSADANLADFDDYFDEAETLAGRGAVALSFANDGRSTRTSGRLDVRDFRFRRFAFGATDATWAQHGGTIAAALAVRGAHGALRANGTVAPAAGAPATAFAHAAYRAAVQAQAVDLGTWLPPFGVTAPILGQVDARATVAGRWPRLGIGGDATLANGSMFGYAVREGRVHATSDGARVAFSNTMLDLGFVRFDAGGSIGFDRRDPLALAVHAQSPDLSKALQTLFPKGPHADVAGAVQADARIGGTFAKPRATAGFELTDARLGSLAVTHVLGSVGYDGSTLTVNDAEATFAKGTVLVAGSLPLSLQPFGVRPNAPVSFTLALGGLELSPFAPFVPGRQTKLGGTVNGRVAIEGTLRAPRVIGDIALANGSYVSSLDRAPITNANAQLSFVGTSVALQALHANLGAGTLDGSGRMDLPFPDSPRTGYAIALAARAARVDFPQFGRGTVDGNLELRSGETVPLLSGKVTLSNASIPILSLARSAGGGGAAGSAPAPFDVAFDIAAVAGRNVRMQAQSPYIDIGASGALDLTGKLSAPKLAGVLTATPGGVFSTYNRAFRVQQASVSFDPADGVLPYVDLRAYAHVTNPDPDPDRNAVGSADITVSVHGPADELAAGTGSGIVYASNPAYSQEQIVGLLLDASLFGAVNFGQQQNGTTLRGAPGESNPLLPPGVTPYQAGVINFNQEAFSILNGQFVQRLLAPVERMFTGAFGLTDLELTVDYGGGVGYNALKQIGHRDVYASFGQTLSTPVRSTLGFTARPDATTSVQFNYFQQNGDPAITNNGNGTQAFAATQRLKGIQPLANRKGFTFSIVRKYP